MKNWQRFEQLIAKRLGGVLRPGSGQFVGAKEDVITPVCLVQCKSSKNNEIRVMVEDLDNLAGHAEQESRIPVMAVARNFTYNKAQYCAIIPNFMLEEERREFMPVTAGSFLFPFDTADIEPVRVYIRSSGFDLWHKAWAISGETLEEIHEQFMESTR